MRIALKQLSLAVATLLSIIKAFLQRFERVTVHEVWPACWLQFSLTPPNIGLGPKWTSSSSQPDAGCSHPTTPREMLEALKGALATLKIGQGEQHESLPTVKPYPPIRRSDLMGERRTRDWRHTGNPVVEQPMPTVL
ncbi:uncharacterized [Tachysurus ichikawai]